MIGNKVFSRFSKEMGIDLGTSSTLVYVKDKGIVINEPSVVAVNTRTNQILTVGGDAKKMVGKTPEHIQAIRPLVEGVISDFEVTEKMLKYFIEKVHKESFSLLARPVVVIGIPLEVTEVERKAVEDAALSAGASRVYLVEEPMAAAIGARLPVHESVANLVVDIGGGSTNIAVISLSGIVTWKSMRLAGDELNRSIINYVRENFNLLLGEKTAEDIKIKIGSAMPLEEHTDMRVRGRDLITGLPKEITISDMQVREALTRSIRVMVENIKTVIENTPPELVADVYERGITLTGGGALLKGLDRVIARETQVPVTIADDPLTCVVRGTGILLEDKKLMSDVLVNDTQGQNINK